MLHNMVRLSESKRSQTVESRESSASTIACTSRVPNSVPLGRARMTASEVFAGNLLVVWSITCAPYGHEDLRDHLVISTLSIL